MFTRTSNGKKKIYCIFAYKKHKSDPLSLLKINDEVSVHTYRHMFLRHIEFTFKVPL